MRRDRGRRRHRGPDRRARGRRRAASACSCATSSRSAPASRRGRRSTRSVRSSARAGDPGVEILERHAALGIYEGPTVPLAVRTSSSRSRRPRRGRDRRHRGRTGSSPATTCPACGSAGRPSAMAALHGVPPGRRVVVVASTTEGLEHLRALGRGGDVGRRRARAGGLRGRGAARQTEAIVDGELRRGARARASALGGRPRASASGRRIACDALVLSMGLVAARRARCGWRSSEPVELVGDAALDGRRTPARRRLRLPVRGRRRPRARAGVGRGLPLGEILKRYTTATMGPCQGALCGRHLAAFAAAARTRPTRRAGARTTARPPAAAGRPRGPRGGGPRGDRAADRRCTTSTSRRARTLGWSGGVDAPAHLRRRGRGVPRGARARRRDGRRHAREVPRRRARRAGARRRGVPGRIDDLAPGRSRYLLALDEAGYVMDDGLLCALEDGRTCSPRRRAAPTGWRRGCATGPTGSTCTCTSLNQTAQLGAIIVAGPHARDLLERLTDDAVERGSAPVPGPREITVAGVPCRAIRSGFVGELAFELHHPRSRGPALWDALLEAGEALGISPARARRARRPAPREGPHLPRAGHAARRHPGEARARLGRRHEQAVVRRQAARSSGWPRSR